MLKRISDNSDYRQDTFDDIPGLTEKIADKTLKALEDEGLLIFPQCIKDSPDLNDKQMVLEYSDNSYHAGNVMGFIGCGDQELVITSRFIEDDQNDYFLQYLLSNVIELPNIFDLKTSSDDHDEIFDLITFMFPYYLKQAMRKGPYKTYIRKQYNDANVRGVIDIPRFIKQDIPFLGRIAYTQREYSYDNALMELIRHTIEFIRNKPYGHNLLRKVDDEVSIVVQATPHYSIKNRHKVIIQNTENPVRHAYYKEYGNLQRLCLMILKHYMQSFEYGHNRIYGVLFDGAWLWEEYLNTLVNKIFYHPMNKEHKEAQYLFNSEKTGKNPGEIYPDFIGRNADNRLIADAKYKPQDHINGKDYLQLLAYMFRFDAKHGYYLYPEKNSEESVTYSMNSGSTYEKNVQPRDDITVTKYGFKIPSGAESFEQFCNQMKESETRFKKIWSSQNSQASEE